MTDQIYEMLRDNIAEVGESVKALNDKMPAPETWADMRQDVRQIKESIYGNGKRGLVTRVENLEFVAKLRADNGADCKATSAGRESQVALEAACAGERTKVTVIRLIVSKTASLLFRLGVVYLCFRFGYIDIVKPWMGVPVDPAARGIPDSSTTAVPTPN